MNKTYRQLKIEREHKEKQLDDYRELHKGVIGSYLNLVNDLSEITRQANKALLQEAKTEPYECI